MLCMHTIMSMVKYPRNMHALSPGWSLLLGKIWTEVFFDLKDFRGVWG